MTYRFCEKGHTLFHKGIYIICQLFNLILEKYINYR